MKNKFLYDTIASIHELFLQLLGNKKMKTSFLFLVAIVFVGCYILIFYFKPNTNNTNHYVLTGDIKNQENKSQVFTQQPKNQTNQQNNAKIDAYPINQIDAKKLIQSIHNQSVVNYLSVNDSG